MLDRERTSTHSFTKLHLCTRDSGTAVILKITSALMEMICQVGDAVSTQVNSMHVGLVISTKRKKGEHG